MRLASTLAAALCAGAPALAQVHDADIVPTVDDGQRIITNRVVVAH